MALEEVKKMIRDDEGSVNHVYVDSEGVLTCGIGHALHVGSLVPPEAVTAFFEDDFETAVEDAEFIIAKYDIEIDDTRKAVLINMAFQLGRSKLLAFKKMIAALIIKDYDEAAAQILDSIAAGQCPARYKRLAEIMRKGKNLNI